MKVLNWVSSILTVLFTVLGFLGLCYVDVDCSWCGVAIAVGSAIVLFALAFAFNFVCNYCDRCIRQAERAKRAARRCRHHSVMGGK